MTKPFNVPFNIPKGTAVADSYRIAPKFDTLSQTGVNAQGQIISGSSFNNYGPGLLMTPTATFNFTPYPTTAGNIANPAPAIVAGPSWLTLAGDNGATTIVASPSTGIFPPGAPNNFYLQLDWPRVPSITIGGTADLAGPVPVTFFGFDYYGQPMQHSYVVEARGTYPGPLIQDPITPIPPISSSGRKPCKAFYRITGVYFNGTTGPNTTVTCRVSNTFGLPFVMKSVNDVNTFGWATQVNMMAQEGVVALGAGGTSPPIQSPAAIALLLAENDLPFAFAPIIFTNAQALPAGADAGVLYGGAVVKSSPQGMGTFVIQSTSATDRSIVSWGIINAGQAIMAPADLTVPVDPITGADVRGLIELPDLGETWAPGVDGNTQCIFQWYCEGFDNQLNILNAGGQPQQNGIPNPPTNNIVPSNIYHTTVVVDTVPTDFTINTLYGNPQYYTGVPL